MGSPQKEAKIAFGDLLCSTVASKSGTFAVGGRANEAIPNFPAIPGLLVSDIAGIDPDEPVSLPLSKEIGAKFFKDEESPRSVATDRSTKEEAIVLPSDQFEFTHPGLSRALVMLAESALQEMGAVDKDDDDPPIMLGEKVLIILPPSSYLLNTELYQSKHEDNNEKHFATLLIQLPSMFSQELAVEHGDAQVIFDMGGNTMNASRCHAQYETHYVCHYKDGCTSRSVLDLGDLNGGGYRAVLAYYLNWEGESNSIPRPRGVLKQNAANAAMAAMAEDDRLFVIPLSSGYSTNELDRDGGLSALGDRDMAIVSAIEEAGSEK